MTELQNKILAIIHKEHIKPVPKWKFLLKNYGRWVIFGFLVLLGSLSVSVVIFMFTDRDWDIYRYLDKSLFEYILLGIPYFWFLLVSGFVAFAYYDLKKTRTGYKYSFTKIGAINVLASILLGTVFFYSGLGAKIDTAFADNLPYYRDLHGFNGPRVWDNPSKGLLAGEITEIMNEDSFVVQDLKGNLWMVACNHCLGGNGIAGVIGVPVKLIGKSEGEGAFQVSEIRPFNGFVKNRMMISPPPPAIPGNIQIQENARKQKMMRSN